jgi:hypothetical protein
MSCKFSTETTMTNQDDFRYAETAMRWYGWGSPVGVGIFIVCLALSGLAAAKAVGTFTNPMGPTAAADARLAEGKR